MMATDSDEGLLFRRELDVFLGAWCTSSTARGISLSRFR